MYSGNDNGLAEVLLQLNAAMSEQTETTPGASESSRTLLEIKNLQLDFATDGRVLRAVDGDSLTIGPGETVCLVGESGSGKTVTALSIAQLVPMPPARYSGGEILLNGENVL